MPVQAYSHLGWIDDNNRRAQLSDYRGRVLVLDFYATWCEPCRRSIPKLNELQKQYGSRGLEIIGLNVGGPDDRVKVKDFVKDLHIEYPLGFPDKPLTDLFLADDQTIPQTFVFDRAGQLTKRFIGYDENTSADLETVIKVELERSRD
jgi:cytochrome c biogenesis protein CcmG, thiol:disulfide interchange protein DsbE